MDNEEVRQWLDEEWNKALEASDTEPDPDVDALANSNIISIRYALVTQMLGKIADPSRSLMALQLGDATEGAWNARSFATAVVLPWERDNQQVLGMSPDPYVSKPLRRPRLDEGAKVQNDNAWKEFVAFLAPLDTAHPDVLHDAFRRVLRAFARRLAKQSFTYPIPQRISQAELEKIVASFLGEPSGGLRPLAVSAALFRVLGEAFRLFSEIRSKGINEADSASGVPGDVMCLDGDGNISLAVEVKDTSLTLAHVQEANLKAKQSSDGLSNFLFAVPGIRQDDAINITMLTHRSWGEGLNIYNISLPALLGATLILLDESWRVRLVVEIGKELDERQNQPSRRAWYDLLNQ